MLQLKPGNHRHLLHIDDEESARMLMAALGIVFTLFLAACVLYVAVNLHDYI